MSFLFFIGFTCAAAVLLLLYVLAKALRALVQTQKQKEIYIETKARILHVYAPGEKYRTIPFARLKVEVFARNGEPFISDVEGFYSHDELQAIKPGVIVWVNYQPNDKTELRLLKKPALTKQETRMFVKEGGEIIAVKRGLTQSPEARHRRLIPH